jgi:hypothetical protein
MKLRVLLLVVVFFFMVLVSCAPETAKKEEFTLKGFYLGMEFDAAKALCKKIFGDAGIKLKEFEEQIRKVDQSVYITAMKDSDQISVMDISANKDRKVSRFSFHPNGTKIIFKPKDTADEALAKMLSQEYKAPELKLDGNRWEYKLVEGVTIKLRISVYSSYITVEGFML